MTETKTVVMTAIIGLVILEAIALFNGINGTLFSIIVAAIAGLGGYIIPSGKAKEVKK